MYTVNLSKTKVHNIIDIYENDCILDYTQLT